MSDGSQRDMTLGEWLEPLAENHAAIKELNYLVDKAKKWDALINSDLIRILGSGGLGENHQHFGMEIWDVHPPQEHYNSEFGRDVLNTYVETIIKRKLKGEEDESGTKT